MKTALISGCFGVITLMAGATQGPTTGSLWGTGYNGYGALGIGNSNNVDTPVEILTNNISTVAGGGYHTVFLKSDGSLWGMGDNQTGQLGYGTTNVTDTPGLIVASNVIAISAGEFHTLFLKSDGSMWGMGENGYGQLCNGTTNDAHIPIEILASNVTAIAAGGNHSLFIKSDGSLWTAGYNNDGQLGWSTRTFGANPTPQMIASSNVIAIAGGDSHSLFIKGDGSLWGMGLDGNGELGDGTYGGTNGSVDVPEQIPVSNVVAIAAGGSHSMFIKSDGSLWAMGHNYSGQLGDGTTDNGNYAVNVPEQIVPSNVVAIAAGDEHSLFLKGDGSLWAVGGNNNGELGDGTFNTTAPHYGSFTPEEMVTSNVTRISAGYFTSLYLVAVPGSIGTTSNVIISLSASPSDGGGVSGGGTVAAGSTNMLSAVPAAGFEFTGWTGDATGTNNPLTVIPATNLNITANFATVGGKLTLTIITNGVGTVSPNPGNEEFVAGRSFTLTASAKDGNVFSNWTGSITTNKNPLTFKLESSMVLQANFVPNPFPPFVGTYNGLFTPTNGVTEESAGMLKGLKVGTKGTYSGTLLINGGSHALSGSFNLAGEATNRISRPTTQGGSLVVVMTLSPGSPAPQITGSVLGTNWTALLTAGPASNTVPSAEYTMLIPPDPNNAPPTNSPGGDGYALITNYAGARNPSTATVKITGALADGTAFSQTVPASYDGSVPVYASLYAGKGLLTGWINLILTDTNAISASSLTWIHPRMHSGLYTNGFTNVLLTNQIQLSLWTNPPAEIVLLTNLSALENIYDTNAEGAYTVSNSLSGTVKGALVSGTINPKTGLLKVTLGSAAAERTIGYGAVLLNASNGGGYFLTKTNAQAIKLTP